MSNLPTYIPDPDGGLGGHYSPAVKANGFVFVAGQVPRDKARNLLGETIEAQTLATLQNLQRVLGTAGCGLEHVVKINVILADLADFARFNAAYAQFMGEARPARTTIGAALNGVLVEVEAVAVAPSP